MIHLYASLVSRNKASFMRSRGTADSELENAYLGSGAGCRGLPNEGLPLVRLKALAASTLKHTSIRIKQLFGRHQAED